MGRAAEKILERMRATPFGWSEGDFRGMLSQFGFDYEPGSKHSLFIHRERPHLRMTVPRHNQLAPAYAKIAVALVDRLRKEENDGNP